MSDELIVIYRAMESHQAHLLCNVLEQYGIQARVTGDALLNAGAEFTHSAGFPVIVNQSQVELARQIVSSFERHVIQAQPSEEVEDEIRAQWLEWPTCPKCLARQTAICPHCNESGDDFPLAEWQGDQAPGKPLLVCPTCDDVFVPQFYRDCPWCDYHFGSGLEPRDLVATIDYRLAFGATLAGLAVLGYLWMLYN